jgi:diguanylate cyclase (GGDEF)-like protein/PAS domain S-box-containing protein
MHRLLRRQIERHLGSQRQPDPEIRRLLREVEAEYRRADDDRAALQRALELLADLTRRQAVKAAERGERASPLPRLMRRLFEQAPFAAIVCDADLEILAWNSGAQQLFGYPAAEAVGRGLGELLLPSAERTSDRHELKRVLERGELDQSLRVAATRGGAVRLDEWTLVPLKDRAGRVTGAAVMVREPVAAANRFTVAALATGDGVFEWDVEKDRLWLSDAWLALVGAEAAAGSPADWLDRVHPSEREALMSALRAHLDGQTARFESEHRLRDQAGGWKWVLARGRVTRDDAGKPVRLAGTMMDVTERRAAAERALNDALHDPLTRLPNRALFLDLVKRTFARTRRREEQSFAVVFLDLDRFKAVNDSLGHAAGDELLVQFARRLQTCLREGDTLARHGGDEFTVLLDDVKGPADAISAAQRIHDATAKAFQVAGHEVVSTASIGIAIWSPSYARAEDLLHDADTAMYRAKAQGRARTVVFDATMRERAPQLLELEADLRRALVHDEFRVYYLPVVDVASGRIQGLEALIRWAHPKRGLVQPEHFVPFAEETGLIVPIGSWLLRQAGRDFLGWRRAAGGGRLSLHVNVSPKQIHDGALLQQLEGLFQDVELDPNDLALDVTEATIEENGDTAEGLTKIRRRGVRLCMDDFGSGRASLATLHRLQLDSLKIDRSLFEGGSPRGSSPDLVRTIVSLARAIGKPVVAEGVETAEQFGFVRELGCTGAQGFYFSPPVDSSATGSLLQRAPIW